MEFKQMVPPNYQPNFPSIINGIPVVYEMLNGSRTPYSFVRPSPNGQPVLVFRNVHPSNPDDKITIESLIQWAQRKYKTEEDIKRALEQYKWDSFAVGKRI